MRKLALIILAAGSMLSMAEPASAQFVRPGWNHLGSPVCPRNYDYHGGWCKPVYGYDAPGRFGGGGRYYGEAVPPRWNHRGSAVCPEHYDYVAGMCRPRG